MTEEFVQIAVVNYLKYQIFNQTDQETIGNTQPLHEKCGQG